MQPPAADFVVAFLSPQAADVYPPPLQAELAALTSAPIRWSLAAFRAAPELATARVLVTTWDVPPLTPEWLARMPRLEIVFYGAGSVKPFMTEHAWSRGIRAVSAAEANAIAVADYTVAQIVCALKGVWTHALQFREHGIHQRHWPSLAGVYGAPVGLISVGAIGRLVTRRLVALGVAVSVFDPYLDSVGAAELGVQSTSLEELFARCCVVSCHAPLLPETAGLLRAKHFRSMPPGATFINTARGAVVNQSELVAVLRERPDLWALLDVTDPEPLPVESPVFALPNVVVTPHIAGAFGRDCARLGRTILDELRRYLAGTPLIHEVMPVRAARSA